MANNEPSGVESRASDELKSRNALVFISHDTRDAAIAEAFSKLLSSVSAGVLKSFRSSDKRGTQGIEYGVEWYPEIMKKLEAASDVVCLLTPFSINRPWILYEAGVAKGKLDTSVHGLALGMVFRTHSVAPSHRCGADAVQTLRRLVRMQRRTQREGADCPPVRAACAHA
ncbi:TIR domain-containing protein [Ralstonia pseudosolanacearum]|uniref:TIR domain-containing protein n=1 Tax=Ralstonia pseudosolanacearum TaxID=1310165 RepID=UPI0018D1A5FE|nr:TIR domain-containing protein [Ralstonia pseudosolanacearum]